jgi:hypothetical protein
VLLQVGPIDSRELLHCHASPLGNDVIQHSHTISGTSHQGFSRARSNAGGVIIVEMAGAISIATLRTRDEAEVVRGLLESAGIHAWIEADDAGGAYPFSLSDGVHVVVDREDGDAAAAILSDRSER